MGEHNCSFTWLCSGARDITKPPLLINLYVLVVCTTSEDYMIFNSFTCLTLIMVDNGPMIKIAYSWTKIETIKLMRMDIKSRCLDECGHWAMIFLSLFALVRWDPWVLQLDFFLISTHFNALTMANTICKVALFRVTKVLVMPFMCFLLASWGH